MVKIAYSITSKNFLAYTSVLIDSFMQHNPEYRFCVFTIDDKVEERFQEKHPSVVIQSVHHLEEESVGLMRNRYSDFEFCNALKPYLADYLMHAFPDVSCLLYLDADMKCFSSMFPVEQHLEDYNIIITPHVLSPLPNDNLKVSELDFLRTGLYNAGFLMIKPSRETDDFLKWWKERTYAYCRVDLAKGLFVDQIWLNLIPLYFKQVKILEHLGVNVGHWNLHERHLEFSQDIYWVNNIDKLVLFHFSGFDPLDEIKVSKYSNRFSLSNNPVLKKLFGEYRFSILENAVLWPLETSDTVASSPIQSDTGEKSLHFMDFLKRVFRKFW
jgi:lipopolysaccharide biosynthesis glycosyltransferase